MNYLKSFFKTEEQNENYWISGLILFKYENRLILDRGFIVVGNLNNYSFYCQFKNFTIINGELYYNCIKKIKFENVFLHLKIGETPYNVETNNKTYWNLFFNSPSNKLFKSIILEDSKIKVFNFDKTKKININDVNNPLFLKKQVYDKNCVLFTGIKMFDI